MKNNQPLPAAARYNAPCEIKIISLWEPWATLMAIKAKRIETRGWYTDYRGPVAIHATAGGMTQQETFDTCSTEPFLSVLKGAGILRAGMYPRQVYHAFPRGHIIAVGDLVGCFATEARGVCDSEIFEEYRTLDTRQERAFGNYDSGRFGHVYENVRPLRVPIPFKSRQGMLLDVDADTARSIFESLQGSPDGEPPQANPEISESRIQEGKQEDVE